MSNNKKPLPGKNQEPEFAEEVKKSDPKPFNFTIDTHRPPRDKPESDKPESDKNKK